MPALFPDFATDRAAFERSKVFWSQLADEEVSTAAQVGEWTPWFQILAWEDSSEMMEGAVVFSLYSVSQNKSFRVQQFTDRTKDDEPFITSFTDAFGEGHLDRPIPNLFIGAIPTDENLPLIRRLIARWFGRVYRRSNECILGVRALPAL
ncbi:MAG: hypothetical protein ABIR80_03485 [Opitutaceae bacterium]